MDKERAIEIGKDTQFTPKDQPTGENKSKGKVKSLLLKDVAKQIVGGTAIQKSKELAEFLGLDSDKLTLEMVAHLVQLQKAIRDEDTRAYNAVMDRLLGKADQHIKMESKQPIQIITDDPKHFKDNIKN